MARETFLGTHRAWEDWAGIGLGILIGLSPWYAGPVDSQAAWLNSVIVGVLVLVLAAYEFVKPRRWEEIAEFALGLWLVASPSTYGYAGSGQLRFWHFGLGALVALLAALELWQDWALTDQELAKRGQ